MSDIYELPKMRKKLTKEELLKKADRIYQEDFPINKPEYDGDVTIRAVADTSEFNLIQEEIEKLTKINEHIGLQGKRRSEREIYAAAYCCQCMIEPDVTIDEAFQMLDNLGPVATIIANRIMLISGLTSGSVEAAEEKLRKDTFPSHANGSKFQISEETPIGVGPDAN
jgi:hypothetical protein